MLWDAPANQLMRTSAAFRKILIAIGSQQLYIETQSAAWDPSWPLVWGGVSGQDVNALYGRALHSYRRCSFIAYRERSLILLFGTVLLVNLEALRGSVEGMLIHLSHSIRLALELQNIARSADEATELAGLLHHYCNALQLFVQPDQAALLCAGQDELLPIRQNSPRITGVPTSPQSRRNNTRLFSFLCSPACE
jgi:hypothetical protein